MTGRRDRRNRKRPRVVLYHATNCHLCERARETLAAAKAELDFEFVEIGIDADPELEARYRELIPVVEIDGRQAFVYFVPPEALRKKLERE